MSSFVTKKTLLNIVLVVLLITALVLGYLVYQKFVPTTVPTNTPTSPNDQQQATEVSDADLAEFEAMSDIELVRAMPMSDASNATLQAFSVQVSERAVAADRIVLDSNCEADPAFVSVPLGGTITFVNQSGMQQGVVLTPDQTVELSEGQSNTTKIDFSTGQGVYGYSCNGQQILAGILLVQ